MKMEVRIENVTKVIQGNTVVDQVNLSMHSGKVIGLSGINGSGKTMLMRLLSGMIFPTKGQIWINDKLLGKDIEFPESMGILIENPAFLDGYSGIQNLKFLAGVQNRVGEKEIYETLKMVGLDPNSKKKYRKYSLGMKQRLGIAGAVLEKPELLILDEPFNALDTEGVILTKKLITREKTRGALVVLTCHDSHILKELADEIHYMENGKVIKSEKKEE